MITATIHLGGFLADLNANAFVEMPVPHGTGITDVIAMLGQHCDDRLRKAILTPSGDPDPGLMVSLERQVIPARKLVDTVLTHDCRIDLVPLVAGG